MTSKPHKFYVTWQQFQRDCQALAWRLLDLKKSWKGIITIPRGGLVASTIVARELGVRYIDTICLASYEDKQTTQGEMKILKKIEGDGEGFLVVDDLVDTGRTVEVVRTMLPKAYISTIYAKPEGKPLVDQYITEVSQNTWIVFPWESEEFEEETV